ncbi:hypothetical protein BH09VER1_BH09VER1_50760 [soil metagenome]
MNAHGLRFHSIPSATFAELKLRSAFELGKWDQQYQDHPSLADYAIELDPAVYHELAAWAEAMAGELFRAEREVLSRPALLDYLALPRAVRQALLQNPEAETLAPRLCRFDFHPTEDGWQISEVNSDVPGGLLESDGLPPLLEDQFPASAWLPNTTSLYLDALLAGGLLPHPIGLVHATAYSDDRQVMRYLQKALEARGQPATLLSPDNLRWQPKGITAETHWYSGPISRLIRFYPAEWMANLPASCRWRDSAATTNRWMSNPLQSLISQSKRFPLVWDQLSEPMAMWRRLLPETRPFRHHLLLERDQWIFKPALGRVGEGIVFAQISSRHASRASLLNAAIYPRQWIAQRPFRAVPWQIGSTPHWPCLGVYTVNEKAGGIYARTALRPLIDGAARDTAIFLANPASTTPQPIYETAGTI